MKARQAKIYTPEEIAEYSATHTPHRRVIAAQVAESKLLPARPRSREIENEFNYQTAPQQGLSGAEVHRMAQEFDVTTREIVEGTK